VKVETIQLNKPEEQKPKIIYMPGDKTDPFIIISKNYWLFSYTCKYSSITWYPV